LKDVARGGVASVNILAKTVAIISMMAWASVALAQSSAQDVSQRLAKLSENLKKLDTNGDGMIDAKEASTGVGQLLIGRYYPGGPPKYPVAITEILKAAETQIRGGTAPGAFVVPASSAPAVKSMSVGASSDESYGPSGGSSGRMRGRRGAFSAFGRDARSWTCFGDHPHFGGFQVGRCQGRREVR